MKQKPETTAASISAGSAGGSESLGERIRRFRNALGMDQPRLAELSGLGTKQAVSAIELGSRDVKAFELARIAKVLHVPMDVLLGVSEPAAQPMVLWRRRAIPVGPEGENLAGDSQFLEREARLRERAERYALLEEWCGAAPGDELPEFTVDASTLTYARASELADQVRTRLELGSVPAASLADVLADRFGVKIFYERLGHDGEASAACVRDDDVFGAAVLMNADEAPVRRSFSLAHELFHLVTWTSVSEAWVRDTGNGEPTWYATLERCAQSFAAALLIPADQVIAELHRRASTHAGGDGVAEERPLAQKLQPSDYAFVARARFQVSPDALLWRLVNLGVLNRVERDDLARHPDMRATGRLVGRGHDQVEAPPTFPTRYWELLRLAFRRGEAGLSKLATFAEMNPSDLHELLTAQPVDAEYEASIRESAATATV